MHIAAFVLNGLLNKYISRLLELGTTTKDMKKEVNELFEEIEHKTTFVKGTDRIDYLVDEINSKIHAYKPKIFIIFSMGSAMGKCEKIKKEISKIFENYDFELSLSKNKKVYLLTRKDELT